MTPGELEVIEAKARGEYDMCLRLAAEVRRLQVEVDEVHDDRLRVMAERDALRAETQHLRDARAEAELAHMRERDALLEGKPDKPPDTVAVPRWLLVSILAHGLSDDDVERLCALLKEERERFGVLR